MYSTLSATVAGMPGMSSGASCACSHAARAGRDRPAKLISIRPATNSSAQLSGVEAAPSDGQPPATAGAGTGRDSAPIIPA